MNGTTYLTGKLFLDLIRAGASNLRFHVKAVNDLNVFPIPDGDTGYNMLLTMLGGAQVECEYDNISEVSKKISQGMLLGARGNSGVILSQFFDGISHGLEDLDKACVSDLSKALCLGVKSAYDAVLCPTEGTVLTVMREATEYAASVETDCLEGFFEAFIFQAKIALDNTPELLDVLKKAGVVDSGGAGLIYIIEGMLKALKVEAFEASYLEDLSENETVDFSLFDENSEMTYGYCTELLVRLQNKKTDIEKFNTASVTAFLETVGDSIVVVKNDSILKIHVHTKTPEKVLEYLRNFGEFLTVKIENMTLQHSNSDVEKPPHKERTKYAVVTVASGEGVKATFTEMGADVIVDGGQSMNPSTGEFIEAFDKANADNIFVFPNNRNIILAAKQAASAYQNSKVFVVESKNIGDGYAALSMMNTNLETCEEILSEFEFAMDGVVTVEISKSVRDSDMQDNVPVACGDYIGIIDKEIIHAEKNRLNTVKSCIEKTGFSLHDISIIIRGADSTEEEAKQIEDYIKSQNPFSDVYIINGGQNVYSYILIAE